MQICLLKFCLTNMKTNIYLSISPVQIMKFRFLLAVFFLFLVSGCGRKIEPTTPTVLKDDNWLDSYQVFYRDPLLIVRGKIKQKYLASFTLSKVGIQISSNGKNFLDYKESSVSKKAIKDGFEITYLPFLVKNSFFQAVFLDNKIDYFSGWKRAVASDKVPPQPKASSLRIHFKVDGTSTLSAYFANRKNYTVLVYGDQSIYPIYQIEEDQLVFLLPDKLQSLKLFYADEFGNESEALDISNKL